MGKFGVLTKNQYPPSPPFYEGRFTNGSTWIETLSKTIGKPLHLENNFAMGGATSGSFNINEPLRAALDLKDGIELMGLQTQIDKYLSLNHSLDSRALYVVWAGGHDYGNYLEYGFPDVKQDPPVENLRKSISN